MRGRHNNCDTKNIAQNYFRPPPHTVRENSYFITMFPQDAKNLTHIHISLSQFRQFCHRVWSSEKHNFVTIDLTSTPMNGKYRQNFNRYKALISHGRPSWKRSRISTKYKEVLYHEATVDWYAQRDLDEVEREERNCMHLAHQATTEYKF